MYNNIALMLFRCVYILEVMHAYFVFYTFPVEAPEADPIAYEMAIVGSEVSYPRFLSQS